MKAEFTRWYETAQIALDSQAVDTRWNAVQAAVASTTEGELEALVRAAFRAKQNTATTAGVRTKLGDGGDPVKDEEFALLGAATLALILAQNDALAARAAVMIGTAHVNGLRQFKQPMDLIGLAASARLALARITRRRPPMQIAPMPSMDIDTTQAEETSDPNEGIRLLGQACTEALERLAERHADFEQRALRYISIQDEELDMLWWLQGGRSNGGQRFADLPGDQRPFILARDLAEVTFAMPGAAAIESLLARAGVEDGEPLEIAKAIQSLPIEWLKAAIPDADMGKVSTVTTPIHDAFRKRLDVNGDESWIPFWAGACDVDKAAQLSPLRLADLCYCEQLLIRK